MILAVSAQTAFVFRTANPRSDNFQTPLFRESMKFDNCTVKKCGFGRYNKRTL